MAIVERSKKAEISFRRHTCISTEHRYIRLVACIDPQKHSICGSNFKAGKFVVCNGELYFKKKRKGKVRNTADIF